MGRYKALIGPRLRARGFAAQQTEAAIGVAVLNRICLRPVARIPFVVYTLSHSGSRLGSSCASSPMCTNAVFSG